MIKWGGNIDRKFDSLKQTSCNVFLSTFSVEPVVMTSRSSCVPAMKDGMVDMKNPSCHSAIVLAIHQTSSCPKTILGLLAPKVALKDVQARYNAFNEIRTFEKPLKSGETVYSCVPMTDNTDEEHLFLKDHTFRSVCLLAQGL